MEYFVPAWHNQLVDWAYNTPRIQFYDAINQMRVLQDNHKKIGLVLTDYQPQLTTKLNQLAFSPDYLFSVYDYLQGISTLDNQILDITDFNWPEDAYFDYTLFRIIVISHNRLFAKLAFDTDGKILSITYFDENGQQTKTLMIDSRGFISSKQVGNEITYYDQIGHWRFKYNTENKNVVLNPTFNKCQYNQYQNLNDLISEIFKREVLEKIKAKDHLIVSLDDKSLVPLNLYQNYKVIYSLNHWNKYTHSLLKIKDGQLIVDSRIEKERVEGLIGNRFSVVIMPPFQTQFKLGHSQRMKRQMITVFAEHIDYSDLKKIADIIYHRLIKAPKDEEVQFLTYTPNQSKLVTKVIDELKDEHKSEITINRKITNLDEAKIIDVKEVPNLIINQSRVTSIADLMHILDKTRLLISWTNGDDFLQAAAVSVGIPKVQDYETSTLVNDKNGKICKDFTELTQAISFYLDSLQNWNRALVYNVKLLNLYSEKNLMKIWNRIFNGEAIK